MAVSTVQISNANLLNPLPYTWTVGTGSITGYTQNGDTAENQRLNATGPYGATVVVWGSYPSGNNQADGGWETTPQIPISNTSLYRYSVWVRRTSATTSGTFYFGLHTNGTGDVLALNGGASNTNPYWDYRNIGWFEINQWYLVVGHIYPYTHAGTTANPASGIYTREAGMIGSLAGNIPQDCKFPSNATTAMNRTYHYYSSDSTSRLQFYQPRIDLVDGNEPSISKLLAQDLNNPAVISQGYKFPDNSIQTTAYSNNQQHGQLIGIMTYTQSSTWYKPPGCSRVLVKLVGGGGGAAAYMESGGGGGYAERVIDVSNIDSVSVTVGAAGTLVSYYAAGGNGGTSSFGSFLSATGGYGSNRNYSHTGGAGGVGSGGAINLYGGDGTGHTNSAGNYPGGNGGSSFFGSGGTINRDTTASKLYPGAPGAGGPGGRTNDSTAGANGEVGLVVVYAYK